MSRLLKFTKSIIIFFSLIILSNAQTCPCVQSGISLLCNVESSATMVNVDLCATLPYQTVNIQYKGQVVLNLISSSIKTIYMNPFDSNNNNQLQISSINTNAAEIQIQIQYSPSSVPLFPTNSAIVAPNATLNIIVKQMTNDSNSFQLFDTSYSSQMNFTNFALSFDPTGTGSGTLNLHNLVRGFMNIQSITITGINHSLTVDNSQMQLMNKVNKLSLKHLMLNDRILDKFISLKEYNIEECSYTKTAKFLISSGTYNISLTMKNNYPLDGILPNFSQPFSQLQSIIALKLIEPRLNSSVLRALRNPTNPKTLFLELNSYDKYELDSWIAYRPLVWELTIRNIINLNIFSSKFFNKLDALQQVTLQGTFPLETQNICPFVGINTQPRSPSPTVRLISPQTQLFTRYTCANTYIAAINIRTMNNIQCLPDNTCYDCQNWANIAEDCKLIAYEANCSGTTLTNVNPFYYGNSYLYNFFQNRSWLYGGYSTTPRYPRDGSVNIGAIIGAVCALIVAIVILGFTMFCVYQRRKRDLSKSPWPKSEEKYIPSSDDSKHVSIATSKTSQSSRYALENSFFPPMQPNDEIAPPLYTAPSESVKSVSHYNAPSAPPAHRDSVSTHATHLYETVDP